MTTEDIEVFLTINACKNISHAANALFMSQSTVSYRLATLEKEVGVKLFFRKKGLPTLSLTDAGERFFVIAEKMRDLHKEALSLQYINSKTRLTVCAVDSVNMYLLTSFYDAFIQENSQFELTILNGYSEEILPKLEQRAYDVGITNSDIHYPSVDSQLLFQEEYVLVMREDIPSNFQSPVNIKSLDRSKEVYQSFDSNFAQWHDRLLSVAKCKANTEMARMTMNLINQKGDWSIVPISVAKHYIKQPGLFYYPIENPPFPRKVFFSFNIRGSAAHQTTINHFKESLQRFLAHAHPYLIQPSPKR